MLQRITKQIVNESKQSLLSTEKFVGIKTGFNNLDSLTDGFANGQLILMEARLGMGKTSFACSLIDNVCVNSGKKCVFYTAEISVRQMIKRIIRLHGNVKCNENSGAEYVEKIKKSSEKVKKARLWIDDTCIGEPDKFIENCRQLGKAEKIDLIIIDDLHLFESDANCLEELLRKLKALALKLKRPMFALSRLKRSVEKRADHIPQISDLPSHKIMEAAADEILFLYRDAYYNRKSDKNLATISIARHGKHDRINTSIYYDPDIPMFRTDLCFYK